MGFVSAQHAWELITDDQGKPALVEIMNAYTKAKEPYLQYWCKACERGIPLPINSYRGLPYGPCVKKD